MALTNLSQITTSGIATGTDLNIRNITGAAATFTGNVTVGGTLTYDDVTNIDSVGLITARSGINVTGGNIGIGRTNPSVKLDIAGSARIRMRNPGNNNYAQINCVSESAGTAADLTFAVGTGEALRIQNDGKVGINSTTPRAIVDFGPGTGNGTLNQTVANYQAVFEAPTGTGNYTRNIAFASRTSAISAAINAVDEGGSDATGLIVATGTAGSIAERLRITSDGDVGIGIVSPGAKLDVFGAARIGGTVSSSRRADFDTNGKLTLAFGDNNNVSNLILQNLATDATTNHGSNIGWQLATNASSTAIDAARINVIKEQQWTSSSSTQDSALTITLAQNGSLGEKLRITSGGNVNIGGDYSQTTYQAQVTGDLLLQKNTGAYQHPQMELYNYNTGAYGGAIKFTGNLAGTKYTQATIRTYGGSNTSDGSLAFFTGDGTEKVRIDSAGRIGVNVAPSNFGSGAQAIEVHSSGSVNSFLALTNSTTGSGGAAHGFNIIMSNNEARLFNRENGDMTFWTNATERIRIDNAGVAKFQNPTGTLILASTTSNDGGRIVFRENTTDAWSIDSTRANAAFSIKDEYNSSTERFRIDTSGRVNVPAGDFKVVDGNSGLLFQEYNSGASLWLDGANGDFAGGDYYGIHANNSDQLAIGYAGAESWKMDSSGRVVNVSQPSFAVTWNGNSTTVSANSQMQFDKVLHNVGSHYSTSTYRFTAPVTGSYQINFYSIWYAQTLSNAAIYLYKNGSRIDGGDIHFSADFSTSKWHNVSYSIVIYLTSGDYINLQNGSTAIQYHGNNWSRFSGYLLG